MRDGIGNFLWKLSVALYLIANGALALFVKKGLALGRSSDFEIIFKRLGFNGDTLKICVIIAGVIAFVGGIAVLLEMFDISVSFRDTLLLIIAIIWAVYVIVGIVSWVMDGFDNFWPVLQRLAVHTMVLGSLMIASGKFSR